MTGKGAPKGNRYAAKSGKGKGITIYLSQGDIALLQKALRAQDKNPEQWSKFAHEYAKNGIYREIKAYMDAEIV
jgi:hypothetical protein